MVAMASSSSLRLHALPSLVTLVAIIVVVFIVLYIVVSVCLIVTTVPTALFLWESVGEFFLCLGLSCRIIMMDGCCVTCFDSDRIRILLVVLLVIFYSANGHLRTLFSEVATTHSLGFRVCVLPIDFRLLIVSSCHRSHRVARRYPFSHTLYDTVLQSTTMFLLAPLYNCISSLSVNTIPT